MLHLIPRPLHRALYRVAFVLRMAYWRIARPTVTGCRIIALDPQDRVLLVRQTYGGQKWQAPTGGMASGEDPLEAASRELSEETGCTLAEAHSVAQVLEHPQGANNVVHIVVGRVLGVPKPDHREVREVAFFALDALPADLSPRTERGLHEWVAAWQASAAPS
jgi:8-oxo-dGTP pyrophosphatase MutT (NUDIX family)